MILKESKNSFHCKIKIKILLKEITTQKMIHSLILINRQGKVRLMKWYENVPMNERTKMIREVKLTKNIIGLLDICNGNRKIKQIIKFYRMEPI
jgi:hypothetical protein